ncbi:glycosyltransferase [candidate division KSB1 bacterium]|nr:glycosyltransferase [candidate division KSB1 bacterium]
MRIVRIIFTFAFSIRSNKLTILVISTIIYLSIVSYLIWGIIKSPRIYDGKQTPFVSIVIATRDSQETIQTCLNACLRQDYDKNQFECIVVDDGSKDKTIEILALASKQYHNLTFITKQYSLGWKSSKKEALHLAIQQVRGELVLYTDSDCTPPPSWLRTIVKAYNYSTGAIAGFSYQVSTNSTLNRFLHLDSMATALVSAASIAHNHPVTACGRNIAITENALNKIKGYTLLPDTLSGDDDFILQTIAVGTNLQLKYQFEPKSHMPAQGPASWRLFFKQKSRHLSAGKQYKNKTQIVYLFYHTTNLILWGGAIIGIAVNKAIVLFLILKWIADYTALKKISNRLDKPLKLYDFFLWNFIYPLYHLICAPKAFFYKTEW